MGLSKSWPWTLLKSQVAAVRFKKLMKKAGGPAADAMRGILVNFVSEAIKKLIF